MSTPSRPRRLSGLFGDGGCRVEFKSHPYYDDSDARDWLYLRPDDWTELEPGPEKVLQDLLRRRQAVAV